MLLASISNAIVSILDLFKYAVETLIASGSVGAGAVLILVFLVFITWLFGMALNGKTGAY